MKHYNLLVLEVVSRVRVRLQGEGEEVDAGVVGREDGPRAVPPVVGVGSLGNSYIRQHRVLLVLRSGLGSDQ